MRPSDLHRRGTLVWWPAAADSPAAPCCGSTPRASPLMRPTAPPRRSAYGVAPVPAFAMGVLTACVGGIIRDVLAGEPSILMRPELYVTAAALASGLFVSLTLVGVPARSPPPFAGAGRLLAARRRRSRAAGRCPPTRLRLAALQHRGMMSAMTDDFYRIQRLPPYVFAEVNAMKAAARARGEDIVDLGMGNPDGAPPKHVIDKLAEVAAKPDAHRYSAAERHPRPAEGAGGLLPAPLRRRRSTRTREVIVTLGSQGRPRQPRPGDHRAGRRRARAQPVLSDPQLRLHHRRRRDPLDPGRARRGILRPADERRCASPCRGRRCW